MLLQPIEIQFGHPGYGLMIRIISRAYPDDPYSRGWLTTHVDVELPGFNAHIQSTVQAQELYQFYVELETLYKTLQGTATSKTLGHWLEFKVTATKLGHIYVSGSIAHPHLLDNILHFEIEDRDQTYLLETVNQLKLVIDHYHLAD
jgi:hypothetical protein